LEENFFVKLILQKPKVDLGHCYSFGSKSAQQLYIYTQVELIGGKEGERHPRVWFHKN